VSYESEDRYWTDYLRVALPVIGLLLMLALFWFWAQQFIGDDGNPEDVAQSTQTSIATVPGPTPTNTVAVVIDASAGADATETPDGGGSTNGGEGEGTPPGSDQSEDCGFAENDVVVVTAEDVRLREGPVIDPGNIIEESISQEAELRIIGACYEEDDAGNQFWRVRNQDTSQTGYVAGDYLAPVEE